VSVGGYLCRENGWLPIGRKRLAPYPARTGGLPSPKTVATIRAVGDASRVAQCLIVSQHLLIFCYPLCGGCFRSLCRWWRTQVVRCGSPSECGSRGFHFLRREFAAFMEDCENGLICL
jgi:hypothetical protein